MSAPKFTAGPKCAQCEGETLTVCRNIVCEDCGYEAENPMFAAAPDLLSAASALLAKIDDMTSEEFSRGEEREEREALRAALAKAEGGTV